MASTKKKPVHELTTEEAMKKLFHPKVIKHAKTIAAKARKK
jgi:hypothetical protein